MVLAAQQQRQQEAPGRRLIYRRDVLSRVPELPRSPSLSKL
jgi:hypothetical protein